MNRVEKRIKKYCNKCKTEITGEDEYKRYVVAKKELVFAGHVKCADLCKKCGEKIFKFMK